MSDLTDEDLDWDEWMQMTDAQQEAAVNRELDAYTKWYAGLTLAGQIAHSRRASLNSCLSARHLMSRPYCPDIIRKTTRERLKAAQVRLLKVRIWRATGTRPGEA